MAGARVPPGTTHVDIYVAGCISPRSGANGMAERTRHTENSHCCSWDVCGVVSSGTDVGKTALVVVRRPSSSSPPPSSSSSSSSSPSDSREVAANKTGKMPRRNNVCRGALAPWRPGALAPWRPGPAREPRRASGLSSQKPRRRSSALSGRPSASSRCLARVFVRALISLGTKSSRDLRRFVRAFVSPGTNTK